MLCSVEGRDGHDGPWRRVLVGAHALLLNVRWMRHDGRVLADLKAATAQFCQAPLRC